MAKHPVFPLFIDQFLGDTGGLTNAEVGSYMLLMMAAWRSKGALADDDKRLARIARVTPRHWREKMRPLMTTFWVVEKGLWRNKKLGEELRKRDAYLSSRSHGGKQKALNRKKTTSSHEDQEQEQVDSSLSKEDRESESLSNGEDQNDRRTIKRPAKFDVSDWRPDEADYRYAEEQGRDPDRILQDITDWCANATRAKRLKQDPRRFWQKWCRTARDRGEAALEPGGGKRRRSDEILDAGRRFATGGDLD